MALLMKILALDILSPLIRGGVKAGINNLKNLLLCSLIRIFMALLMKILALDKTNKSEFYLLLCSLIRIFAPER